MMKNVKTQVDMSKFPLPLVPMPVFLLLNGFFCNFVVPNQTMGGGVSADNLSQQN